METLWQDIRYGIRILGKSPGFTAIVVLILALGIGVNTAIFSLVKTVLLEPLPYRDPERLVLVRDVQSRLASAPASFPEYLDWRQQEHIFENLAALAATTFTLTGHTNPEQVPGLRASPSLFPLLGVRPFLGRTFLEEDDREGADRVCLLTYGAWQHRFAGDRSLLGKTLVLDGQAHTVVGILPQDFHFAPSSREIYVPLRLNTETAPRSLHFLYVVGRLRPGLPLKDAQKEIAAVGEQLGKEHSSTHRITMFDLREQTVGNSRLLLLVLMGAVGFVLLIACANVANLTLGRAAARQREIAIRAALGASRGRLVRQVLTESLVLALAGGALAVVVALWVVSGVRGLAEVNLPRIEEVRLDPLVLAFTLGVSLLVGLLFGLAPIAQWRRGDLHHSLKEGGGLGASLGAGHHILRRLLVVSEVALSLVLLLGAGLLLNSLIRLMNVGKGFQTENILTFTLSLPRAHYGEKAQQVAFFRDLRERVAALPRVESVGAISNLPLTGSANGSFTIEGVTFPRDQRPRAEKRMVSPGYFRAMGIPVLRGRSFAEHDAEGAPSVAIINDAFARAYFPGQNPVGKRVAFQWGTKGFQEIVGVVGNVRDVSLAEPANPAIYVCALQRPTSSMDVAIRTSGDPMALVGAVRAQVAALDKDQPIARVRRMEEVVSESVAPWRTQMMLLGSFAALALVLAAVGIYGVVSFLVTQRIREIGIRIALGAQRKDILRLVLRQGMGMTVVGLALGALGAVWLTRFLAGLLFGVEATDPVTFVVVTMMLTLVALTACVIPARRATRVDPMVALRYE